MGLFGKSFEEKVQDAVGQVRANLGLVSLDARVQGKTVTLTGTVDTMEMKARAMQEFNSLVETENTVNQIRVHESPAAVAAAAPAPQPEPADVVHEVVRGDTLGELARKYYGRASLYTKIFEANRDQLDDPDRIRVGQKLRIPKP